MNLDELKAELTRLENPLEDSHADVRDIAALRHHIAEADPAWLVAYDVELGEAIADIEASASEA